MLRFVKGLDLLKNERSVVSNSPHRVGKFSLRNKIFVDLKLPWKKAGSNTFFYKKYAQKKKFDEPTEIGSLFLPRAWIFLLNSHHWLFCYFFLFQAQGVHYNFEMPQSEKIFYFVLKRSHQSLISHSHL